MRAERKTVPAVQLMAQRADADTRMRRCLAELAAVPGVEVRGDTITVPADAVAMVDEITARHLPR